MSFWKTVGAIVVAILCLTLGLPVLGLMGLLLIGNPAILIIAVIVIASMFVCAKLDKIIK